MTTLNAGRKAAQKLYKATECERCGSIATLQRHHKDRNPLNNDQSNIEILCQPCHKEEHVIAGDWGKGMVEPANCEICGAQFQPKRSRRKGRVLCGNPKCLSEMGRRSAALRWGSRRERTDLKPLATDKYRSALPLPSPNSQPSSRKAA